MHWGERSNQSRRVERTAGAQCTSLVRRPSRSSSRFPTRDRTQSPSAWRSSLEDRVEIKTAIGIKKSCVECTTPWLKDSWLNKAHSQNRADNHSFSHKAEVKKTPWQFKSGSCHFLTAKHPFLHGLTFWLQDGSALLMKPLIYADKHIKNRLLLDCSSFVCAY